MQVIIVEGGIGAGKSAFLAAMEKLGCRVVYEIVPLEKLKLFLEGKLDALGFQLIMAIKRIQAQNDALEKEEDAEIVFMERSVHSDYCFAKTCIKDAGDLHDYEVFARVYLWPVAVKLDLRIYLRGPLEGETRRIKERGRSGEQWYLTEEGTEYRRQLNRQHDNMFRMNNSEYKANLTFNPDEIDWRTPEGAQEVWGIINATLKQKAGVAR